MPSWWPSTTASAPLSITVMTTMLHATQDCSSPSFVAILATHACVAVHLECLLTPPACLHQRLCWLTTVATICLSPTGLDELEQQPGAPGFDESTVDLMSIDALLLKLSPDFRAAAVLRDQLGLDYAEIGEVLDLPAGTVRSRISRVLIARRDPGRGTRPRRDPSKKAAHDRPDPALRRRARPRRLIGH